MIISPSGILKSSFCSNNLNKIEINVTQNEFSAYSDNTIVIDINLAQFSSYCYSQGIQ